MFGKINTVELKNDYILGFYYLRDIYRNYFTVNRAGWGIFTVILGCPWRANGDSQHLEAHPELGLAPVPIIYLKKNYRTGPFSK